MSVQHIIAGIQESAANLKAGEGHEQELAKVRQMANQAAAYLRDQKFYRMVAAFLGAIVLVAVIAIAILLGRGTTAGFDSIASIGSAAVGGLVGLFMGSRE